MRNYKKKLRFHWRTKIWKHKDGILFFVFIYSIFFKESISYYISSILFILSSKFNIVSLANLGNKIKNNPQSILNTIFAVLIVYLWLKLRQLKQSLNIGFIDNFDNENLEENYSCDTSWRVINNELIVTNSWAGGIVNKGIGWGNYIFRFQTKIENKCTSWIIRARNLQDYCMLQVGKDSLVPHRMRPAKSIQNINGQPTEVTFGVFDVGKTYKFDSKVSDDWLDVEIEVKGKSLRIDIDGENKFFEPNFSKYMNNPTGSVGFRNCGDERARFRNIKVILFD
jgi:hypothetical protein